MFKPSDLFDLAQTDHADLFARCDFAWEGLQRLKDYLGDHLKPGLRNRCVGVAWIDENVFIGEGTVVEDGAMIKGPAIIGRNCEIRHNAYIRGPVIIGDGCVIGNASELKNAFLFNEAKVPHFNYVGDSILGFEAHLGAGVKICNVKLGSGTIKVQCDEGTLDSGLRKLGAIIGDRSEVGCNAVLNPGSVLGRSSVVYPNVFWRGTLASRSIAKNRSPVEVVKCSLP
jgi:NDP-sugar pyrophosphorylase family protein